jgi:hypothetical protein
MTHIVHGAKTKKALRATLEGGGEVFFEDPSIFNPRSVFSKSMKLGEKLVCTNHPKRSWFAQVERTEKGWKVT